MNKKKYCALVTGATRGIGFAIAKKLLDDGMEVIATGADTDGKPPEGASYYPVDFLNNNSLQEFIEYIKTKNIDILINNAGINKISNFSSADIKDFDKILQVNLRTPFLICQSVLPYMKKQKWGRIVNLTSIYSIISKEFRAPYSASKFGLDGMTVALAAEVSEMGILANSVAPGFIDTDLTRNILGEDGILNLKKSIPIKRLGQVSEIASFVSWLVSEENTYISGQNLTIDGGFSRV
jgi:3-oxoacyl-[acyl-carrier protein] reductase